ncbi:hypothetical protein V8E54_002907 [Elaphomyces granulatus]
MQSQRSNRDPKWPETRTRPPRRAISTPPGIVAAKHPAAVKRPAAVRRPVEVKRPAEVKRSAAVKLPADVKRPADFKRAEAKRPASAISTVTASSWASLAAPYPKVVKDKLPC